MSRRIVMNLAMSIDGYIADENGGYDWIKEDGSDKFDTKDELAFDKFLEEVDIVVMGKRCYDQQMHKEFSDKQVYVATSEQLSSYDNIHFINGNISDIILEMKKEKGGNIYLFGGGVLIDPFVKSNLIDEYIIGIIPVILGKGRPLFLEDNPFIEMQLTRYYIRNEVIIMHYIPKNSVVEAVSNII